MPINRKGPLFNGEAKRALDDFMDKAEDEIAQQAVNDIHLRLGAVLKHPTGYYESQIRTDRQADSNLVNDNDVIYGPWLEGIGSRNKTTRFKGYATFRKVTQNLDRKAGAIAQRVLPHYLGRMNY